MVCLKWKSFGYIERINKKCIWLEYNDEYRRYRRERVGKVIEVRTEGFRMFYLRICIVVDIMWSDRWKFVYRRIY